MTDIIKLAECLFQLSISCGMKPTMRRCIHVLHGRHEVASEADVVKKLDSLVSELNKSPLYTISGVQEKIWRGSTLYKFDGAVGHPYGLVEHIVSRALDYCSVSSVPVAHVRYDSCIVDGKVGCRCDNFLLSDEYEQNFWDVDGSESLQTLAEPYLFRDLAILFLCDYLFYNPDRHHGNIVVTRGRHRSRLSPVFDMGNSLTFVDEPKYESFVPDPYGVSQLHWALKVLGGHPVFRVTDFYNKFNRAVEGYSKRIVDEYLERVLLCAESEAVQRFWEVI